MNLLVVEMRRALRRRVIRVMIADRARLVRVRRRDRVPELERQDARRAPPARRDRIPRCSPTGGTRARATARCTTAALFLLIGGFFAGAAVAGAEWRAGHDHDRAHLGAAPRPAQPHPHRRLRRSARSSSRSLLQVIFLAVVPPRGARQRHDRRGRRRAGGSSLALAVARTVARHLDRRDAGGRARDAGPQHRVRARRRVRLGRGDRRRDPRPAPGLGAVPLGREHRRPRCSGRQMENVEFTRGPVLALATIVALHRGARGRSRRSRSGAATSPRPS